MPLSPARAIAFDILQKVAQGGYASDLLLARTGALDSRDACVRQDDEGWQEEKSRSVKEGTRETGCGGQVQCGIAGGYSVAV